MQYITHMSAWIFYCKKPVNANRNTKLKTNTYVTNIVEHQEILEEIRSGNKYFWFKKKKKQYQKQPCQISMAIKISWKTYHIYDFLYIYNYGCTFFLRKQILSIKWLLHHLHESSCTLFSGHAVFPYFNSMSDNILIFTWLINSTRCQNANERKSLIVRCLQIALLDMCGDFFWLFFYNIRC